jgi:putative membrane protein
MLLLLGTYLFVYPFGIVLLCLDIVPPWGTWMGGALLIMQGLVMGLWLVLNYRLRGLLAALAILVLSWAVEHIGVTTGFPFGGYYYTDILNFKIGGVVPLAVPFAWLLVIPTALSITEFLLHHQQDHTEQSTLLMHLHSIRSEPAPLRTKLPALVNSLEHIPANPAASIPGLPRPVTLISGSVAIVGTATRASLLDLLIEPVAVHINGYWIWDNTGSGYYGVPGSNFAAWWVTSVVLAAILFLLTRLPLRASATYPSDPAPQPALIYQWLPPVLYILNLTMFSLVTLAHGKILAAAIGSLMITYLVLAWLEPRLVRWIMGESHAAAVWPDQTNLTG